MKKLRKLTALLLAVACVCTMLPTIILAEDDYTPISLGATQTQPDALSWLAYAPSTNLSGVAGYKEGDKTVIDGPTDYGVDSGKYKLTDNCATGSWLIYDYYDQSTAQLQKYYKDPYNPNGQKAFAYVDYPYALTGLSSQGVTGLKSFSGKLYTTAEKLSSNNQGIIYNYKDAGNFDEVIIAADTSSNLFCFRYFSYRTLVDKDPNGNSYKKVYKGGAGQDTPTYFELPTDKDTGYLVINFTLEYQMDGVKLTVTDGGTHSASATISNSKLSDAKVENVLGPFTYGSYTPTYADSYKANDAVFDMPLPSQANMAGLTVLAGGGVKYASDLSVTYDCKKSQETLVSEFTAKYAELLAKDNVTSSDQEELTHALKDYEIVVGAYPAAAEALQDSYDTLRHFKGELIGEITANGTATVEEFFDGTNEAPIVFEPSTLTTGSAYLQGGQRSNSTDAFCDGAPVSGVSVSVKNPTAGTDYFQGGGMYTMNAPGNNGWFSGMYDDSEKGLIFKCYADQNNEYAWRFAGMDAYGTVTGINSFSGTMYSDSVSGDRCWGIVYNYIDNGNFDYASLVFENNNDPSKGIFRLYSYRTEEVTAADGTHYKKVYLANNDRVKQDFYYNLGSFLKEEIGGTEYFKMNFTVTYHDDGVSITCQMGGEPCTVTYKDTDITGATFQNRAYPDDKKLGSAFANNVLGSQATMVGFATRGQKMLVDNVKVTFDYRKSQSQLVDDFNTKYELFLETAVGNITSNDAAKVHQALADYETVVELYPAAATALANAKQKLDSFAAVLADSEAGAFFTTHSTVLNSSFAVESAAHVTAVRNARAAYEEMPEAQAKINEKAVTLGLISGTQTLLDYFDALIKTYYFNGNVLVYDDFESYVNDSAFHEIWEDVSLTTGNATQHPSTLITNQDGTTSLVPSTDEDYITVPKQAYRAEGMLKKFEVTFLLDTTECTNMDAWYDFHQPVIYYAVPGASEYKGQTLTLHNNTLQYTYGGSTVGLDTNFPWAGSMDGLAPGNYTVKITYEYEYVSLDEPGKPNGFGWTYGNLAYDVSDFIRVVGTLQVDGMSQIATTNGFVIPLEGKSINKSFTAGVRHNLRGAVVQEVAYTYEKSEDEFSADFEAYSDTYGKTVSSVSKDDLTKIQEALALYETLNAKQQGAYSREKANLVAMQPVAQFHANIAAVTPATDLAKLNSDWTAMGIANANVSGALADAETAYNQFRPEMYSATIKASSDPTHQNLRFNVNIPQNDFKIVEIGIVLLPNAMLGSNELTRETAEVVVSNAINADGILGVDKYRGYLSGVDFNEARCNTPIAARAYIVYEVESTQYTLYSVNTRNANPDNVLEGVKDGVAVRSVNSIASAMAADLIAYKENHAQDITWTDAITDQTTSLDGISALEVLKFVVQNKDTVEEISVAKNNG